MGLTRVQLLPQVRQRLAAATNDALLTQAALYQSINNGLVNFAAEREWYWLDATTTITTSEGVGSYDLPANCTQIHVVNNEAGGQGGVFELDQVQYRELIRYANSQTNIPRMYALIGNQIILAPVPNSVFNIFLYYQQAETVLTGDSDEILCPDFYADVVVTYAALDAAIMIRDQGLIGSLTQLQQQQLERVDKEVWRSDVGPRIVTRTDNRLGSQQW